MEGVPSPGLRGIIPCSFEHVFEAIGMSSHRQYLVRASFLEIYNEEVRDLLSKNPKDRLELKEHKESGVYVKGLNAFVVKSVPEIGNVLEARGLGLLRGVFWEERGGRVVSAAAGCARTRSLPARVPPPHAPPLTRPPPPSPPHPLPQHQNQTPTLKTTPPSLTHTHTMPNPAKRRWARRTAAWAPPP